MNKYQEVASNQFLNSKDLAFSLRRGLPKNTNGVSNLVKKAYFSTFKTRSSSIAFPGKSILLLERRCARPAVACQI